MRGRGYTFGAVSILNAIASGKGVTCSISLKTEAMVRLIDGPGTWKVTVNGSAIDSRLAVESAREALLLAGQKPSNFHGTVETITQVPIGVGLKSSSSSSVAILLATLNAVGENDYDAKEVLLCSARASLKAKVSVTGAYDDAASSLLGGVNWVDNHHKRLIVSRKLPEKMNVVIRVPREPNRRSCMDIKKVHEFKSVADKIFRSSFEGKYWPSMTVNGMLYSMLLGYESMSAITALEYGALGAGLSGTGPAVAAVFDATRNDAIEKLRNAWSADGSLVLEAETNNAGGGFAE